MAIPRRIIFIAAGALATGAVLYVRNKMRDRDRAAKDSRSSASTSSSSASSSSSNASSSTSSEPAAGEPSAAGAADGKSGSQRELSLFLAGESWYDEVGWQGIWEREAIESPESWLRTTGKQVLVEERKKLAAHPALLAGCRRRWIVVCRYAGIDVSDSAALWNATEAA